MTKVPLNPRTSQILNHICQYVIRSGEPISSATLQRQFKMEISTATIRNEMMELEAQGYLHQLHSSSGRTPTEEGYRLYVESLHKVSDLNRAEMGVLDRLSAMRESDESLFQKGTEVLSELTRCPAFSVTYTNVEKRLRELKLFKVDGRRIMAIFIDSTGQIFNHLMEVNFSFEVEELERLSRRLSGEWSGQKFSRVSLESLSEASQFTRDTELLLGEVIQHLNRQGEGENKEVISEGSIHFLDIPEFQDISRLKEIFHLLNSKQALLELFDQSLLDDEAVEGEATRIPMRRIRVKIGRELPVQFNQSLSFLCTTVEGAHKRGWVGLLGPVRMDYERAISALMSVSAEIHKLLFYP